MPLIEILSKRLIHRVLVYHFALPYHQYFLVRTPPGERIIDVGSLVCFLLGKVSCVTLISEGNTTYSILTRIQQFLICF